MPTLGELLTQIASLLRATSTPPKQHAGSTLAAAIGYERHIERLIEKNLETQGTRLVTFATAREASEWAANQPVGIVLLNAAKAEMQADVEQLKANPAFSDARILPLPASLRHSGPPDWPDDPFSGPTAGAVVTDR